MKLSIRSSRFTAISTLIVTGFLAIGIPSASAQETGGGGGGGPAFGVGTASMLTGPVNLQNLQAAQVAYDTGIWHAEGLVGLQGGSGTNLFFGGRFWYHLHATSASDFSIGGGLGLQNIDSNQQGVNTVTRFLLDIGIQLRAFIVPNVALSGTAGMGMAMADGNDLFGLGAQALMSLGITYYFR